MKARLVVLVIVVVGIGLAVGGWWLITSSRVANTYLGTQARRYLYFSPLTQKIGMDWDKLPFAIEVTQEIKSEGGLYLPIQCSASLSELIWTIQYYT